MNVLNIFYIFLIANFNIFKSFNLNQSNLSNIIGF